MGGAAAVTPRGMLGALFARPIAHRGLHRPGGPVENTVAAALAAASHGYGIECDVLLSRDGRAMVFHDETFARLAGHGAAVGDLDTEAIGHLRLADGSAVPTLRTLLAAVAGRVPLVIEMKGDDGRLADAVLGEIAGYAGVVALESFSATLLGRCNAAACPVGLVGPAADGDAAAALAKLPRCDFLSWSIDRLGEAATLRPALPRSAWTVRTAAQQTTAAAARAQIVFEGYLP